MEKTNIAIIASIIVVGLVVGVGIGYYVTSKDANVGTDEGGPTIIALIKTPLEGKNVQVEYISERTFFTLKKKITLIQSNAAPEDVPKLFLTQNNANIVLTIIIIFTVVFLVIYSHYFRKARQAFDLRDTRAQCGSDEYA